MQLSRSGLRVTTPIAVAVGRPISATLSYRDDVVEVSGVIRWRKEATSAGGPNAELAFWEVGIALTSVGEVAPDGIWRTLTTHKPKAD